MFDRICDRMFDGMFDGQELLDGIDASGHLWVQCDNCLKWRMLPTGTDLGGEDTPWYQTIVAITI